MAIMLPELNDYDWSEAFHYASDPSVSDGCGAHSCDKQHVLAGSSPVSVISQVGETVITRSCGLRVGRFDSSTWD